MLKVNTYFDDAVKSIAISTSSVPATIGAMAPGSYIFKTDVKELMKIVSGEAQVKLPDHDDWETFQEGECFEVEANLQFEIKTSADLAYLCKYLRD